MSRLTAPRARTCSAISLKTCSIQTCGSRRFHGGRGPARICGRRAVIRAFNGETHGTGLQAVHKLSTEPGPVSGAAEIRGSLLGRYMPTASRSGMNVPFEMINICHILPVSLGRSISDARKEVGMTQQELADKLKVHRRTVVRLDGGEAVSVVGAVQAVRTLGRDVALVPRFAKLQIRP